MIASPILRRLRLVSCSLTGANMAAKGASRPSLMHSGTFGLRNHSPRPVGLSCYHASKTALAPPLPVLNQESPLKSQGPEPTALSTGAPVLAPAPPKSWILSRLPAAWVPYGELIRIDKPAGTYYLFFPTLFSTLMAAPMTTPMTDPGAVVGTSLLFFTGALVMRGAGCTINDLWDRNLDPHVARTRLRPIARGAVTPLQGLVFTGAQLLTGLAVLLQFPASCFFYAVPSLVLVAGYPLAKRVTYYPQFVLGLTFSWGAIMGFPALGVDVLSNGSALAAMGLLYSSNVAWTVLYDMIYAHMDIKDDAKAGIKSIALKHDAQTKQVLTGLAAVQIALLAGAGAAAGAGPAFFIGSCGGAAVTLGLMIKRVNLKSVKDCWWWFVNGCWITGGAIAAGLAIDYGVRYTKDDEAENKVSS
ncbi:monothiol glutaredoxin-5, variant [Gaeumannomyces tritici R3-111a-1]|uniref:4-hydroxybenzoate polyprenyltransferase, mitochondrial n=1 Tax=Gaeumannomyces tritici (strain R3-111a-1) TaxID=644352 RepID=J3NSN7_GAET3|nr:monothiol glutaredoxin-5 [Gaeumannomyces tritici R3-111a-1]XP_009220346.1 monothiol glutaredoxin-5, variant [Gaeumannomyces tritici R3-111a-1]EJT79200.1 monothiol glutaredoxin-5, variant [Gaeumannomyces tritici R3-111a-1]EJT79201.1 monothiol glutaredoxin-5 [Gaeumannomyces tritici R3-111a-1]